MGADVADILIRWLKGGPAFSPPPEPAESAACPYSDNPVMLEVMKYISPEYWDNVNLLIKELDLEFVGATKIMK